jgi:hypothetical protein
MQAMILSEYSALMEWDKNELVEYIMELEKSLDKLKG